MKFFNTAGSVNKSKHYKINPLSRWDMEEIMTLIDQENICTEVYEHNGQKIKILGM